MGIYIYSKAIDENQIQKVFASKDDALYSNIVKEIDEELELKEAVHTIIYGEPYKNELAYLYSYAFMEICDYLSKPLPYLEDLKLGYYSDLINEYLKSDFNIDLEIETFIFVEGDTGFLNLPIVEEPAIRILHRNKIEELYKILKPIDIGDDLIQKLWDSGDEDEAFAYEWIMGTKNNLKFCLDNNLILALFCY